MDIRWARTFGDLEAGDPLLYEDSYGRACIGVNQGSAVASLGLARREPAGAAPPLIRLARAATLRRAHC